MKKIISIIIVLLIGHTSMAQLFNPQSKEITSTYFSDPEVDIPTPAFAKKRGFTTYSEMMDFLSALVKKHPDVLQLSYIGKSQKGRDIPFLLINRSVQNHSPKVKVWIQAGIHGDEPASTEGVLYLISELLENSDYAYLLDKLEIGIIPMANIDGSEKLLRYAADGRDLNRDQTKLMVPESIALKQTFSNFGAEVALDFHEFRPYRRDYMAMNPFGLTNPFDVMFLYSGNLNVPDTLRKYTENSFVNNARKLLEEHSLSSHPYYTTSDYQGYTVFNQGAVNSRSSATSYALSNCISTLVEVRGVGLGKTSFKRRTTTIFLTALSYLKTAASESQTVKEVLRLSLEQRKNSDAVVTSLRKVENTTLPFIDMYEATKVDKEVILRDALRSKALLSRSLPKAYILLPEEKALAEKLKVLGLQVNELKKETTIEVEAYRVTDYYKVLKKYEGVQQQQVKTRLENKTVTFPAGSHIVYTDQKNTGLAIETLEPEAQNSFVSFGLLPTGEGEELPVYRYNSNTELQ